MKGNPILLRRRYVCGLVVAISVIAVIVLIEPSCETKFQQNSPSLEKYIGTVVATGIVGKGAGQLRVDTCECHGCSEICGPMSMALDTGGAFWLDDYASGVFNKYSYKGVLLDRVTVPGDLWATNFDIAPTGNLLILSQNRGSLSLVDTAGRTHAETNEIPPIAGPASLYVYGGTAYITYDTPHGFVGLRYSCATLQVESVFDSLPERAGTIWAASGGKYNVRRSHIPYQYSEVDLVDSLGNALLKNPDSSFSFLASIGTDSTAHLFLFMQKLDSAGKWHYYIRKYSADGYVVASCETPYPFWHPDSHTFRVDKGGVVYMFDVSNDLKRWTLNEYRGYYK